MTFNDAVLMAAKAVSEAPLNMTIRNFHNKIMSLVVKFSDVEDGYYPMTVDEWRKNLNKLSIVLVMSSSDSFGG